MKHIYLFLFLCSFQAYPQFAYQKIWSTYYSGTFTAAYDSVIDSQGNIIVVGSIQPEIPSTNPTQYYPSSYYEPYATPNAHQTSISGILGEGFITKFSPEGLVIWSTFFGGDQQDDVFKVSIDNDDNIYIFGPTTSPTGIATAGAFISDFASFVPENPLAPSNQTFLAKFSASGSLQWGTYIPIANISFLSNLLYVSKSTNSIYISGQVIAANGNMTTPGAFQESFISYPPPSVSSLPKNGFILKFDLQGNRVAGTYFGPATFINGLTTDIEGNLIIVGNQSSIGSTAQIIATPNSYQPVPAGNTDGFIVKLSPDLSTKIWCTYYGVANSDGLRKVTVSGTDIFVTGGTTASIPLEGLATAGAYSETPSHGYMAKFTGAGTRVWGTYLPFIDASYRYLSSFNITNNKLYISGITNLTEGIGTPGVYQEFKTTPTSFADGYFMQFNLDGSRNWGSYFGGNSEVGVNDISVLNDDTLYLTGYTSATDIATPNSVQPNLNSGVSTSNFQLANMFLAKFANPLGAKDFASNSLKIAPNPNKGRFVLSGSLNVQYNTLSLVVYDNLGRVIVTEVLPSLEKEIYREFNFSNALQKGVYFAKLLNGTEHLQTFKILVE